MPAETSTETVGRDELAAYLDWLENVWLPNIGKGLGYLERPSEPRKLVLIQGGRDDA